MRGLIRTCVLLAGLLLGCVTLGAQVASAASPDAAGASAVALPLSPVSGLYTAPPGFTSTPAHAIAASKATATMQALHRRLHPLQVQPFVSRGSAWAVEFSYRQKIVAEVDLTRAGQVTHVYTGPLAAAPYARGHYAPVFDSWWVVVPFSLLFLVPFVDPRRLWRLRHLDAVAVLSFFVSYWLFDHAHLEAAVWTTYPPLIYLLVRMTRLGLRRARGGRNLPAWLTPTLLGVGLVLLVVARVTLSLVDHEVIDVGYASVIGAHKITHGQSLYYASFAHPDTYGPIAYLAYVPFELLFPWHGSWDYLPSAHVASVVFDLVTVLGLVLLGRRLRPGVEGRRLGLALGWAWAACPFTLLGLMEHSNDGLVAMLLVLCLLVFSAPAARGAILGLAAAAKFSPAALLPLFAGRRDRGFKGVVLCVGAFAAVVALSVGLYLPSGGVSEFWNHTVGFQLHRVDVFSPWALHPGLAPVKAVIEAAAVLFALALAFTGRDRSLGQVCALAAGVTIAIQLPAVHWFYYYIIWFMPFALVAIFGADLAVPPEPGEREPLEAGASATVSRDHVLVGA